MHMASPATSGPPFEIVKDTHSTRWPGSLLSGNSETGKLILQRDWSGTPLGPLESWPQCLITSITTALGSRFPTFLFWGPEFTCLYNDGYAAILGEKNPGALGTPLREVWPEAWDSLYGMLKGVMATGAGSWAEDQVYYLRRNGYPEESYFTFSFSRILEEGDKFGGFSCSAIETTAKVIGERRIKTLREIANQSADKATIEEAGRACLAALATNSLDLPFAVLHWLLPGNSDAKVIGAIGIEGPDRRPAQASQAYHPSLDEVLRTKAPVFVAGIPPGVKMLPGAPGLNAPEDLYVLPIGFAGKEEVSGFLSVGLSPHRPFDEDYKSFLKLVAGQIQTAMTSARAQQEARAQAEELAALDRAKTAFFSNISHEFRTPLTLLLGPLEDALGSTVDGKAVLAREVLEAAHRNALRLLKLVNTLLDFSRAEAGRVEAFFEPLDLATYTAELAAQFESVLERGGLTLKVKIQPLSEPTYVDRQLWEKIVFNLLSNAFKFTFEGQIEVSLVEQGGLICLVVKDSGTGIAPDELPKIFQRFHRVQGARSRSMEGSGIGLALVQELVKLHGGSVAVESTVGQGSAFTVSIPKGKSHLSPERVRAPGGPSSARPEAEGYLNEAIQWLPERAAAAAGEPAPSGGQKPAVLIVDDNPDMRAHLARLLSGAYAIESATNGVEGMAAASRGLPQLIISDVMMPGLDGFGFLKQLRSQESTRLIPVILLSARAGDEATIEGLEAGADEYLIKPFSPRELLARVRAQLAMSDLRRDLHAERKARTALAEIRKLSILLDASPDHVFMLDRQGRYVYNNRATAEALAAHLAALGRAGEQTIGRSGREMGFEPAFLSQFEAEQAQAFSGRTVVGATRFPTFGGPRDFEYILSPAPSEDGTIEYLVGITRDVHDLKMAVRVRDQFLSIASHELKTPLTSLKLQTQMRRKLLNRYGLVPFTEEKLAGMFGDDEKQINRLARLVDDMLDISRLNAGKFSINYERVELTVLVKEIVDRMAAQFQGSGVTISLQAEGEVVGSWDRYRLEQVVINLLTNAIKYGAGKPVQINVSATAVSARIVIEDSGIGIAKQDCDRIFGQFERAISANEVSGLGLGLYIAKQIVDAHAGSIQVESEPGVGSRFTIELPFVAQGG